ncbi:FAD-dependent monooxygenase [Pseudonocardia yunnanensis]|uniref:NAD(P)/FAD-dependent oxidoreductase n=1 Tax=Pseudonocardia yunnanensis TaxID=58107 RepID=A0ABW4EUN1_9PSEU
MTDVRTALVIGGGIAGPVAAMALRKAGIEATVHEAYPSTADGIGGTIAIAPNGLAALEAIDAQDALLAHAHPISTTVMTFGAKRLELPSLAGVPPLQVVRRAELYGSLHAMARARGVRIVHGTRLVDAEQTASGVLARFADGTTATADVLIGADGVRSTVRKLIDPNAPGQNYTGMLGFEGLADVEVPARPGTMTFAFGRRAYYLYWPQPGGGTVWGANLPQEPMSLAEARKVPAEEWLRILRETYADDEPGGELARRTSADRLQVVGSLHIMPSVPHWYRDRMVLVGDSVHAPSNSSGQGASLAIESAVEVARCLRDLPDVPSAFATYEGLRRGRVEKIASRAAKINHAKAPGPATRAIMPFLMSIMIKFAMNPEKTMASEQRFRIDWDAPVVPTGEPVRATG